ncbi:MAG: glycosyltransferase, partial [Paracoccaceae bacterium]|nr:glycosyltransferase [Paracoccaceae bacterium]
MPKVIAVFAYRYDADLVPGLIENVTPSIHGWAALDDRTAVSALGNEPDRRNALLRAARAMGADWILAADPDERYEAALRDRIGDLTGADDRTLWHFNFRELFDPAQYRVDGLWGGKRQMRLFPIGAARSEVTIGLHGSWVSDATGYHHCNSDVNLYHLRPISALRRKHRRETYAAADPGRLFQRVGYDYLDDERGMVLDPIPAGRHYTPPYVEDHGLWAPRIADIGPVVPDPPHTRLAYITAANRTGTGAPGSFVAADLCKADPEDSDLAQLAATLALAAHLPADANRLCGRILEKDPEQAHAMLVKSQAWLALGDRIGAQDAMQAARAIVAKSLWLDRMASGLATGTDRFARRNALWRRWTKGEVRLSEGARLGAGPMAVVVLGYRAGPEIAAAVQSLLDQRADTEIVVVNSGGGDMRGVLARQLDQIRLIEVEARLNVGAARNIGIDASNADYIAFLAADCRAMPGWIENRLARHRAGALSVSTPVISANPRNLAAIAYNRLKYHRRDPQISPDQAVHFGQSYARGVFQRVGYFPPGMRIAEDTALNRRLAALSAPVWAPEVLTTHRDPDSLLALWRDSAARA